jgi:predicted PurR-regulated permease PerM
MTTMEEPVSPQPMRDGHASAAPVTGAAPATYARVLLAALGLALCVALLPYLSGLIGAVVLYVVCVPSYRRLGARAGYRLTAVASSVAAVLLVLVPAVWLTATALGEMPEVLARVVQSDAFLRLGQLRLGPWEVGAQLARTSETLFTWISRQAPAVLGGIAHAAINLLIAAIGLYYLLRSRDAGWSYIRPMIPFSDAAADTLRSRFTSITRATVLGIFATALAQGTALALAFWLVGLPNVLVWGVVTGLVSILPVLGSALVWGPGVLVLFLGGRYGAAVVLLAVGLIVVSNIDNIVLPMVYRRVSGLHPLVTIVGAFAGVRLFGLAGLLLGPLAISCFFELVRMYGQEYGTLQGRA